MPNAVNHNAFVRPFGQIRGQNPESQSPEVPQDTAGPLQLLASGVLTPAGWLVPGNRWVVQHGLGTTVLGPAGRLVAKGDRALLTIRDRLYSRRIHPLACQEGLDRHGTTGG